MTCTTGLTAYKEESLEFKPDLTLKPKLFPVYSRIPEAWLLCVLSPMLGLSDRKAPQV